MNTAKSIMPFSEAYKEGRRGSCIRILKESLSDPMRHTTLTRDADIWNSPNKRIGRPKDKWIAEGLHEIWDSVKTEAPDIPNSHLSFNRNKTSVQNKKIIIRELINYFSQFGATGMRQERPAPPTTGNTQMQWIQAGQSSNLPQWGLDAQQTGSSNSESERDVMEVLRLLDELQ